MTYLLIKKNKSNNTKAKILNKIEIDFIFIIIIKL